MTTIADGKDEVLRYLEDETLKRTDEKPGVYSLVRDDAGSLVLFIEGFTFIGQGTVSIGGNLLNVSEGSVIKSNKPS